MTIILRSSISIVPISVPLVAAEPESNDSYVSRDGFSPFNPEAGVDRL